MPLIRDARTLSNKAICSLRIAMSTFNSYDDEGRVCSVLLHLQHACEMLLKAVLVQNKVKVFEDKSGRSIGFEKCLRLCRQDHGLTDAEAGVMRMIDALRDAEQHWFAKLEEDVLYLHTRALITAFDAFMQRALDLDVHSHIPSRVLPVSTMPPGDFDFLVDREYNLITELLQPGNRKRDEARARIRSLLAMEALVAEEVEISEKDISRIEKAIKDGNELQAVFPRLNTIASAVQGEGTAITVHFSKKEGAPVKFVGGDDPEGAAAVRQIDLQKKFHMRTQQLADALKMSAPRSLALRRYLKIDEDASSRHVFEFGQSKFECYSDNARTKMKEALDSDLDMDEVWKEFGPKRKAKAAKGSA